MANDLRVAFLAFSGRNDPSDVEAYDVIMLAAQSLADEGSAGRWERFDAALFLARVDFLPQAEKNRMALDLIALFVYLTLIAWVHPERAIQIVTNIREHAAPFDELHEVAGGAKKALVAIASMPDLGN